MKVGPFPPVLTVSTRVRSPFASTRNDWRSPTGPISLTALDRINNIFKTARTDSLKNALVLGVRSDPGRIGSRRRLSRQFKGPGVRIKDVGGNETGKASSENLDVDHGSSNKECSKRALGLERCEIKTEKKKKDNALGTVKGPEQDQQRSHRLYIQGIGRLVTTY